MRNRHCPCNRHIYDCKKCPANYAGRNIQRKIIRPHNRSSCPYVWLEKDAEKEDEPYYAHRNFSNPRRNNIRNLTHKKSPSHDGDFCLFLIYTENADDDEYAADELDESELFIHNENAGKNRNHSCDIGKGCGADRADEGCGVIIKHKCHDGRKNGKIADSAPERTACDSACKLCHITCIETDESYDVEADCADEEHHICTLNRGETLGFSAAENVEKGSAENSHHKKHDAEKSVAAAVARSKCNHDYSDERHHGEENLSVCWSFLQHDDGKNDNADRHERDEHARHCAGSKVDAVKLHNKIEERLSQTHRDKALFVLALKVKANYFTQLEKIQDSEGHRKADGEYHKWVGIVEGYLGKEKAEAENHIWHQSRKYAFNTVFFHKYYLSI